MIIQCKECGKDVSTEAVACPSCGYPQQPVPTLQQEVKPQGRSHIFGWIALIAFVMSNFIPAIISPLIVLIAIIFALLEFKQGGKVFGGIVFVLSLVQVWGIMDHFGKLSASLGLVDTKQIEKQTVKKYENVNLGTPVNASQIIAEQCAQEWPTDYRMQQHCKEQQGKGIASLERGMPSGIDPGAFRVIRGKCAEEWPRDFRMRAHCETQQFDGYRALQASGTSDSVRAGCAQQWPNDYRMRRHCESRR